MQFIIQSNFKSRAGYNGAPTVVCEVSDLCIVKCALECISFYTKLANWLHYYSYAKYSPVSINHSNQGHNKSKVS